MIEIKLLSKVGNFAESKDIAREIRKKEIIPALDKNQEIILNFEGVSAATQSFMHALISDLFRHYGSDFLNRVSFKNCNDVVKKIISIVVEYMQESE